MAIIEVGQKVPLVWFGLLLKGLWSHGDETRLLDGPKLTDELQSSIVGAIWGPNDQVSSLVWLLIEASSFCLLNWPSPSSNRFISQGLPISSKRRLLRYLFEDASGLDVTSVLKEKRDCFYFVVEFLSTKQVEYWAQIFLWGSAKTLKRCLSNRCLCWEAFLLYSWFKRWNKGWEAMQEVQIWGNRWYWVDSVWRT